MPAHKVTISPNLDQRLREYARVHDGMSIQDAFRELLTMGLSLSPTDDATLAAKQRGFNTVRTWGMTKLSEFFSEMATEAEKQIGNFRREPE